MGARPTDGPVHGARLALLGVALAAFGGALAACSGPRPSAAEPAAPPRGASVAPTPSAAIAAGPGQGKRPAAPRIVVVRADRAASRQPERARTLRRLFQGHRGRMQLAYDYPRVSLFVTQVLEGELDDPDYARRPVGVNALPVVLLDEAAHAAPEGLDGFAGTWRLTRLEDGTLVARAIADTPFAPALVHGRARQIEEVRRRLRSRRAEERLAALDALERRAFYELVPDVVALLDDEREVAPQPPPGAHAIPAPRAVRREADARLRALAAPFADPRVPRSDLRADWEAFWHGLSSAPPPSAAEAVPGVDLEVARLAANQTWPEIVAAGPGRLGLAFSRLHEPFGGRRSAVALADLARASTAWVLAEPGAGREPDGLDVASGPEATAALFGLADDFLVGVDAGGSRGAPPVRVAEGASHAAIAAAPRGFGVLLASAPGRQVVGLVLDAAGRPKGARHAIELPGPPLDVHRGLHPLALAERPGGGFLGAIETDASVVLAQLDAAMRPVRVVSAVATAGFAQPKLAPAADRLLLAWTMQEASGLGPRLRVAAVDPRGDLLGAPATHGADVDVVARPLALPDGTFVVAWIEAGHEVHVARVSGAGDLLGGALVHRGEVSPFTLAATTLGDRVAIAFQDTQRFPFTIRARVVDVPR